MLGSTANLDGSTQARYLMLSALRAARVAFVALAAVTLAACDTRDATAPADPRRVRASGEVYMEFMPRVYDFPNTCTGGVVHVSGIEHQVSVTTRHDDDSWGHGTFHANFNARGVDELTGITYRVINVENDNASGNQGGQTAITNVYILKLVGPGPLNGYMARFNFHETYNADGTVTEHYNAELICG
jgi:hypothetical protein